MRTLFTAFVLTLDVTIALVGQERPQYTPVVGWPTLPQGRTLGRAADIALSPDGNSVWLAEQCGGTSCANSPLDPLLNFSLDGHLLHAIGAGHLSRPHGIHVDRSGNVWVTDFEVANGKGNQVLKFSPDGKLLLALGKAGVAGDGPDTFNKPSDVVVAPNGYIFVADGHGGDSNSRIVKFSKDGRFIKTWGNRGTGPGEFGLPHSLAFDGRGRLLVGDRNNNRIEVFDQDGKFLEEWKQFGRPSGLFVGANNVLVIADSESNDTRNPGFEKGIRFGNLNTGKVNGFFADRGADVANNLGGEGIVVDRSANLYVAHTDERHFMKWRRQTE